MDQHEGAATEMFTITQAVEAMKTSRETIYRWVKQGRIPGAVRVRREWRIPRKGIEEALLTTDEAAGVLNCSQDTILRMINEGSLPYLRYGRRYLIQRAALMEAVAKEADASKEEAVETSA